jgi:flagellar biosynthetic protein FliR
LNLFTVSLPHVQAATLLFIRICAILVATPLLGSKNVPVQVKVGLSLVLTIAVLPIVGLREVSLTDVPSLGSAMVGEVFIGVIIGYTARLLFAAVQMAGQLVGFQMGFGIVNVIDPQTSSQVSIVAEFQHIIALLVFLAADAHHWFVLSIAKSFELIPPFGFCFTNSLMEAIVRLSCDMFVIAAKLSAPILAALLFTDLALGLVARTVPQMNIFIVGFPLKIAIGLLGIGFSFPLLMYTLRSLFQKMGEDIVVVMKLMS